MLPSGTACEVGFALSSSARRSFWLDAQLVIDGVHDPLPGAKVPFRRLYAPMSKQKLNLLKLSTG